MIFSRSLRFLIFQIFHFHQLFVVKYVNNRTKSIKYGRKKVCSGLKLLWGAYKYIWNKVITSNLIIYHKIWEKIATPIMVRLDALHCRFIINLSWKCNIFWKFLKIWSIRWAIQFPSHRTYRTETNFIKSHIKKAF